MSDTIPILFDTDIGSDIDDAIALGYLLAQPRCELVGITTVTGDTRQRAALAAAICDAAGRSEVPIHAGATGPLLHGRGQPEVPQFAALAGQTLRTSFPDLHAVEFLRQTIRSRPSEITLLGVGPMTNLAMLFASDPAVAGMLKQVVLMCGAFEAGTVGLGPGAREWNALCDPVATAMVYRARPARMLSVGINVTRQCVLPIDDARQRFARLPGPFLPILKMAEVWFQHAQRVVFHDPLAAELIFRPDLCGYRHCDVYVETAAGHLEGLTAATGNTGPHELAVTVKPDEAIEHYFATVTAAFGAA